MQEQERQHAADIARRKEELKAVKLAEGQPCTALISDTASAAANKGLLSQLALLPLVLEQQRIVLEAVVGPTPDEI